MKPKGACLLELLSEMKGQRQELPLLLSGTAPNCRQSWGPTRCGGVACAVPAASALLTAKDVDQSLRPHNFTAGHTVKRGHLHCPTRIAETGYKPTKHSKEKESSVHTRRDPGRLSEMEKVGFHFLLVLVRRQAATFCCCWCLGLGVVLQMNTPTTATEQQSHS